MTPDDLRTDDLVVQATMRAHEAMDRALRPGERMVDGEVKYSAAWLDRPTLTERGDESSQGVRLARADAPGTTRKDPRSVSAPPALLTGELRDLWHGLTRLMEANEPVSQQARWEMVARVARMFAGSAAELADWWGEEERKERE